MVSSDGADGDENKQRGDGLTYRPAAIHVAPLSLDDAGFTWGIQDDGPRPWRPTPTVRRHSISTGSPGPQFVADASELPSRRGHRLFRFEAFDDWTPIPASSAFADPVTVA